LLFWQKYSEYANQYVLPNYDSSSGNLDYDKHYYWWIRLYDENNEPTIWYQYYGNTESDTDSNMMEMRRLYSPLSISFLVLIYSGQKMFLSVLAQIYLYWHNARCSVYYTSAAPTTAQSCSGAACV
jgi:hypothetical protein